MKDQATESLVIYHLTFLMISHLSFRSESDRASLLAFYSDPHYRESAGDLPKWQLRNVK